MARATDVDQPFVVQLQEFSGPLDLLLHLIREQEIDITDVPIATIADQFLQAIATLGLNEAADYLEMAATLLRIKVQVLLPRRFDDESWEDPRAALVRRLLEYEQVREVAVWIAERAIGQADRFCRGWIPDAPEWPPAPIVIDLDDVVAAAHEIVEAMPQPVLHRVVPRPLDVEGATQRIVAMLDERESFDLREALGDDPTIADILSVLIALLELARVGRVILRQSRPFSNVGVRREPRHATV